MSASINLHFILAMRHIGVKFYKNKRVRVIRKPKEPEVDFKKVERVSKQKDKLEHLQTLYTKPSERPPAEYSNISYTDLLKKYGT